MQLAHGCRAWRSQRAMDAFVETETAWLAALRPVGEQQPGQGEGDAQSDVCSAPQVESSDATCASRLRAW